VAIATISLQVLVGKTFLKSDFTKDNLRSQISSQNFGIEFFAKPKHNMKNRSTRLLALFMDLLLPT